MEAGPEQKNGGKQSWFWSTVDSPKSIVDGRHATGNRRYAIGDTR